MRAARDEMEGGIEPESELEERSLLTDKTSVNRSLWIPEPGTRTGQARTSANSDFLPNYQ